MSKYLYKTETRTFHDDFKEDFSRNMNSRLANVGADINYALLVLKNFVVVRRRRRQRGRYTDSTILGSGDKLHIHSVRTSRKNFELLIFPGAKNFEKYLGRKL